MKSKLLREDLTQRTKTRILGYLRIPHLLLRIFSELQQKRNSKKLYAGVRRMGSSSSMIWTTSRIKFCQLTLRRPLLPLLSGRYFFFSYFSLTSTVSGKSAYVKMNTCLTILTFSWVTSKISFLNIFRENLNLIKRKKKEDGDDYLEDDQSERQSQKTNSLSGQLGVKRPAETSEKGNKQGSAQESSSKEDLKVGDESRIPIHISTQSFQPVQGFLQPEMQLQANPLTGVSFANTNLSMMNAQFSSQPANQLLFQNQAHNLLQTPP